MKPRKLPVGGRRQRTESDAGAVDSKQAGTPTSIETEASVTNQPSGDIAVKSSRPSRTTDRIVSSNKTNTTENPPSLETSVSSQISKLRANRGGDRSATKQNDGQERKGEVAQIEEKDNSILLGGSTKVTKKEIPIRSSSRRASETHQNTSTMGIKLTAVEPGGRVSKVYLILANRPYVVKDVDSNEVSPASMSSSATATTGSGYLGHDGNQYYCQVCGGFGDVVCCDGCPRVFHPDCIPPNVPSRKSLDNDDNPWYCPDCMDIKSKKSKGSDKKKKSSKSGTMKLNNTATTKASNRKSERRISAEKVNDSIILEDKGELSHNGKVSASRTLERMAKHEILKYADETCSSPADEAHGSDFEHHETGESSFFDYAARDDNNGKNKKRKHSLSTPPHDLDDEDHDDESPSDKKRKKKKKKKRKLSVSSFAGSDDGESSQHDQSHVVEDDSPLASKTPGITHAIPAFFFYLAENRWKIERVLARKHRYFNRLPKGVERNELVAKEAAMWWVKLRPADHSRYMLLSMRDYENRIKEWKDEKNLREMGYYDEFQSNDEDFIQEEYPRDPQVEDDRLTYEKHERLYLSTSVGSKPFKPEAGQSYNRVLLDLLHDTRFHPLPMFCVNRPETETVIDELSSKVTIPFFEVHGPVSTSIGDECLGCSRGWLHYCPVLQRRIPAVEHRAKLQPPLSSLMATRVGLGLRPRLDRPEDPGFHFDNEFDSSGSRGVFAWRDSDEIREVKHLPVVPSCTVPDPSERVDDVVQFIEETTAMKVPEPPRPSLPEKGYNKKDGKSLPLDGEIFLYNKCGRCRTIIDNDTGCVQCRRAQLVINKSKHQPSASSASTARSSKSEFKTLKVHTAMLGRVQMKEGGNENPSRSDQVLSEAMLKERWCPSVILPPQTVIAPSRSRRLPNDSEEQESESDSSSDENNQIEDITEALVTDQADAVPVSEPSTLVEDATPAKRLRASRAAAATAISPEPDRQEITKHYKKEADELQKKTVNIACCGILLALMRRDPLHLFALPVTAEGYHAIIQNPMDFRRIRENVLGGKYSSLGSFASDARLLCENALAYNPPSSIYYKTAKEMHDALAIMQKRAAHWMGAIKDAHASFLLHKKPGMKKKDSVDAVGNEHDSNTTEDEPFQELRQKWPQGVQMLESGDSLRKMIESDLMRTQENETAYYGCWAVCRATAAAEASLAPYPDSTGMHSVVSKRKHYEDEVLREHIDERVSQLSNPIELRNISTWREESVVRLMRKVQSRRLERRTLSENGCSRCDGAIIDHETKIASNADSTHLGKTRKKGDSDVQRIDSSRIHLSTGLGSAKNCQTIVKRRETGPKSDYDTVNDACVSVRGSRIHGMGLFADQPFRKGDVVAEYIGEYIVNPVADEREKIYRDQRIQDYQFRLNDKLVIDATKKGGHGRYINHNCSPNCFAKIIPYDLKKQDAHESDHSNDDVERIGFTGGDVHDATRLNMPETDTQLLRRVMIVAQRNIDINEEITYDYQFPLELDLSARIPCNCQSEACRGFMNWDLPEKGSYNRALLVQKRGANMRDRIRRLGRPLKRDEA